MGDDSVFKKYGEQLGLVGTWWSGQEHRVLSGIDGVLLVVVIGDGKPVVPVDFAIRRPDPTGTGRHAATNSPWVQSMLDGRMAAFRRRGVELSPPMVVADSWFSDSTHAPCGRHPRGHPLVRKKHLCLRAARRAPGRGVTCNNPAIGPGVRPFLVRYVRLRATSPTYGAVTLIVVSKPGRSSST